MKTSRILAGLSLGASLLLAPILFTAQAQKFAGTPSSAPPSVIGGAPITVAVYNYRNNPVTPYWVTPAGVLQPVPGAGPIPPMSGSTPATVKSFQKVTLVFKGAKGGGTWKYFGGANPAPYIVLGTPPAGAAVPPGYKKGSGSAPTAAAPAAPTVNKPIVNKTVTNNPPPAAPPAPVAPGKGRKRPGNKAPDVNVTINPPPSDTPAPPSAPSGNTPAPSTPPSPAEPPPPANAKNDEPEGELSTLTADDPRVVEFLRIHNAARADVGVSPLEWSDDLAFTAQNWADRIGRTGKIEHRPKSNYGENLGWGTGGYTGASAANAWLAEKAKYSPDAAAKPAPKKKGKGAAKADSDGETAHYTQMVWSKSTMVGFGIATTKDGKTVVVANYNPRGNVEGEKPYGK